MASHLSPPASGFLSTKHQGVKFRSSGEPVLHLTDPKGMDRATRRRMLDGLAKLNARTFAEAGDPETETRMAQYEMAYRMQTSVPELMDLSDEPESTFQLYGEAARRPPPGDPNARLIPGSVHLSPRKTRRPKHFDSILAAVAPGFHVPASGELGVALLRRHLGRENVVRTHPISREKACVLMRRIVVPRDQTTTLELLVSHHHHPAGGKLATTARDLVDKGVLHAAQVLVGRRGKRLLTLNLGKREDGKPVDAETLFCIGSCSKLVFPLVGGSLYSTAAEYGAFLNMMAGRGRVANKAILSRDAWGEIVKPRAPHPSYGFGWKLETAGALTRLTHGGSLYGYRAFFQIDLRSGGYVVALVTLGRAGQKTARKKRGARQRSGAKRLFAACTNAPRNVGRR